MIASLSIAQLYAYEFAVHNFLNVPIQIKLPLTAELKDAQVLPVPAKSRASYHAQGWYSGYCLNTKGIEVAKEGAGFIKTPLKTATNETNYNQIIREAAANNGKVNTISVEDKLVRCDPTAIDIVEDANGTLFAIYSYNR